MEKRKNMLTSAKLCRFCLAEDVPLISLYEKKQPKNAVPLSTKILTSISVEVFPSDRMPTYICHRCNFFMDVCHTFKDICREADRSIMQFVQTGTALEPTVWPPSLVKLFRYGAKSSPVVKTVVEGGATVEVSQDLSDSEDDEEDFYSVKIRDGTEDSSACIKVVTSKENDGAKEKKKKDLEAKQSTALPSLSIPGGCWACDECECAFPLQQLLELHKMQKHRTRTVACDLCDAKFFSKYELSAHLSQHSTDLPFACVACEKRFKRLLLLKRHERLTHSDLPQHKCPYCPASFLAEEECAAHQLRHQPAERKYNCNLCDKSFLDRRTLQKHTDAVHLSSSNETLACEYCPERFQSLSRLTRHVRTHAGDRPYPCKHCDKSFSKGYHLQRHLRVKHAEVKPESAEEYPCEQCAASFGTQDDLIYHSAIHATQNFTCPLCQEKFDDVDAVTTHIKSHVTESEFMCDFCELVFTTKEKLDIHVVNSHNDELNSQEMGADESSMEMDAEEEDDKNAINVTEEGDHMLVEIKKPNNFMLSNTEEDSQEKTNNTNSEESEPESAMTEPLPQESPLPMIPIETETPLPKPPTLTPAPKNDTVMMKNEEIKANSILRKAEEIQRKAAQLPSEPVATEKKVEKAKVETNNSGGANDKSLRLLEKELQDLQRTNKREDASKTPVKTLESLRSSRRPQIHTSTPKIKPAEEKKSQASAKTTPADKRAAEKRGVKENKKPEDSKETKTNNVNNVSAKEAKEDKEVKAKEEKESKTNSSKEESKEKSTVKNVSNNNQSGSDESVRRSSRASKVKDYAKMVRDNRPVSVSEEDTDDDEDYVEVDEVRPKTRRVIQKPPPKQQTPTKATPQTPVKTPARKRGRPRKDQSVELPTKLKKDDNKPGKEEKMDAEESTKSTSKEKDKPDQKSEENTSKEKEKEQKPEMEKEDLTEDSDTDTGKSGDSEQKPQNSVVAPTGQMLKKVPIKALPPGVKPLPLPSVALPTVRPSEVCEMQIGKKVMKVQKIVMTKAQVEAMTKKGLVEMKDGTMVLKQGVKLPTEALKTTLVGEGLKREKGAPTRCDLEDM